MSSSIHPFYGEFDFRSAPSKHYRCRNESAFSPLWVTRKLDFMNGSVSCSGNLSYGDFHPCSTFCTFGSVTQNAFSLLWVTGKLDFRNVAGNSLIHAVYQDSISELRPLRFSGIQRKMHFRHYASLRSLVSESCPKLLKFHPCSTFCRFGPVRRRTHFVYYGSLERSLFQKLSGTAEITCVILTSMSVVHFVSFGTVST